MRRDQTLFNRKFLFLCASFLLFMASFNMIIPELPALLTDLGGEEYKGLIISLFAFTALISRPFSGKLADNVGRLPVMVVGALASMLCSAAYLFIHGVVLFLLLRLIHGLSTGFFPTGNSAYLSDIVHSSRRGEAMGILGVSGSVGMAGGPALGGHIALHFGQQAMFITSSGMALLSLLVIAGMQDTLKDRRAFSPSMLRIDWSDLLEPRVLLPAVVMMCGAFGFGMNLTLVPDFSDHLGIDNRGLFFTVMLIASISTRLFAGKASDRFGRRKTLITGTALSALAMTVIGNSESAAIFMLGAVLFGLAHGIIAPSVFAWTVDLARRGKSGKALATMYMALELGIILGSLVAGWVFANNPDRLVFAYLTGSAIAFGALATLLYYNDSARKRTAIKILKSWG